jgi:hypothetical protein
VMRLPAGLDDADAAVASDAVATSVHVLTGRARLQDPPRRDPPMPSRPGRRGPPGHRGDATSGARLRRIRVRIVAPAGAGPEDGALAIGGATGPGQGPTWRPQEP